MALENVIQALGKPYFSAPGCAIYNLDCVKGLDLMPKSVCSLTVTSPPYNIGKEYEEVMPVDSYISWCSKWIQQIYSTTASNGAFWLNVGYLSLPCRAKALPISYLLWDKLQPFFLIQEVVWNYGAGVSAKKFLCPRNEKLLWCVKDENNYAFNLDDIRDKDVKYPNQKKNGVLRCNPLGKNPSDVWNIPKVTSGAGRASKERTTHPAQFPVALIERVIKASSNVGELVCDPFLGSGTNTNMLR